MANSEQIQYYINMINTAVRGEDVRNAIVALLELANSSGTNAYTLNGLSADKFAKQSDMDQILPLATEPTENGTRPVSSGGLYSYLQNLITAINIILRDNSTGSVSSKIQDIADIRWDIMAALNEKGQTTYTTDKFDTFADKVRNIPNEANFDTETLRVSANDTYVPEEGHAYTTVEVDVQPKLSKKTITSLGTFKASDDDVQGFSEVTVSLSSGGGGGGGSGEQSLKLITKTIRGEDLPDTPASTTFKASDDEAIGFSEVTIDVSGRFGEKTLNIDPSVEEENYEASDEGLYGWSKVKIIIAEGSGPFNVEFWNGSTRLETVSVPKNGTAVYPGSTPTDTSGEGKTFVGWNPDPVNVVRNLVCYAQFKKVDHHGSRGEIPLTWEEIGQTGGASIDIGGWKILYYDDFTYDGKDYPGGSVIMQKVAESEPGSTSTWLSLTALGYGLSNSSLDTYVNLNLYLSSRSYTDDIIGWPNCDLRSALNNGAIYNAIANCTDKAKYGNSGAIVNYIKTVTKYSRALDSTKNYSPIDNWASEDKIWIPSAQEITTATGIETAGIKYKDNFVSPEDVPLGYRSSRLIDGTYLRTMGTELSIRGQNTSYDDMKPYEGKEVGRRYSAYRVRDTNYSYGLTEEYIIVYDNGYMNIYNSHYSGSYQIKNRFIIEPFIIGFCL